ncbi:MAG: type I-E CRISPR-associated protein Cse1/CasA [Methanosarcinales archaeon]|nr:MAG: type I-E CRISPR-associated protein Cse1/CasA [Methanosarcinales archaeon]
MNVAFDPWIPVVTTSGKRDLASLCAVLTEGEKFADLAVHPHERVALMRLFFCVAHAALNGPKDYLEWCDVPKKLPEEARKYLTTWKDSFELFHQEKPWLQVAGLSKNTEGTGSLDDCADWTPVSKLNFSFATGSNSTLFDHEGMMPQRRDIPLHEVVVSMIAFQCFSVGGLIGQVFWDGVRCGELANPKKENGPVKSSDAPCVPASMIHAFLRGANIGETIHLNMPTHDDIRFSYGEREIGRPVWEMMPTSQTNSDHINNATTTYVGRLVPLTRLIRMHTSGGQMLLGNGFAYPFFSDGFPQEPTATVIIRKDKRELLSYRPSKALWRELAAVVVKRKAEGTGGPLCLRAIQDGQGCDVIVAALARDKATIVDSVESVFHIPIRLRTDEGAATYESEVKIAEALV